MTVVEFNGVKMPYRRWLTYDRTLASAGPIPARNSFGEPASAGAPPEPPRPRVVVRRRKRVAE
jgi:hypothetical protein